MGTWAKYAFIFTPWVPNSRSRRASVSLISPPLGLADAQPESDLTDLGVSIHQAASRIAKWPVYLNTLAALQRPPRRQETNTEKGFQEVARRASAHSLRLITKSTGRKENLMKKKLQIFLFSKAIHNPPQGPTILFYNPNLNLQ